MKDGLSFDKEIHKIISIIGQDNFISEMCWWFDKDLLNDFCDSIKSEYNIEKIPIKVNFPHQTRLDEINDKLWADFEIVESYKQMWHNAIANHISRKERDKLSDQLQEKHKIFHLSFIQGCQQIIEYVIGQYIGKYKTTQVLCMLEEELKNNLMTFVNNWKLHISPTMVLDILINSLSYEEICKLRYPKYSSFILDNCNDEITINTAIIWKTIFNYLDMSEDTFIKQIDDNVTFYL